MGTKRTLGLGPTTGNFCNCPQKAAEEGRRIQEEQMTKLTSRTFYHCEMLLNQRINDMTQDSLEKILDVFEKELHDFFIHDGEVSIFGFKHFHHDHKYHRKDHDEKKMLRSAIKEIQKRMEIKKYGNVVFDVKKVGLHKKPAILAVLPPIKLVWFKIFLSFFK